MRISNLQAKYTEKTVVLFNEILAGVIQLVLQFFGIFLGLSRMEIQIHVRQNQKPN